MKNERVAILDVRSMEVTFMIGTKSFNSSYESCGAKTEAYEGYGADGFLDIDSFKDAVQAAVESVLKTYKGKFDRIYVGTPSAFVQVRTIGQNLPFTKRRKITPADVERLFDCGLNELMESGRCIRASAMYFETGKSGKYFSERELYGTPSSFLSGGLCYYFADESFCAAVEEALLPFAFGKVVFLPQSLAQARFLLSEKKRSGYAVLVDAGYLTSTVSVVYGDGIVRENSFTGGVGGILCHLMNCFNLEIEEAEEALTYANIASGSDEADKPFGEDTGKIIPARRINDVVEYGVDQLCDGVNRFLEEHYKGKEGVLANNTVWLTGEAVEIIDGISDYMTRTLEKNVKVLRPELAYNDKPSQSSRVSLLAMAISDKQKKKRFKLFGGKRV